MKYLDLETFTDFVCIGSECPFTCCGGGWTIAIDRKTDLYYQSVTGEIGERLKKCISREDNNAHFIMDKAGNCPFLNERGLCDIYLNLGEEHLSNTCTYYPRYVFYSGDIRFAGVSISCPVVSRLYMTKTEPLQIDFGEDDKPVSNTDKIDWTLFNHAVRAFTATIGIAQNRSLSINERLALIILFVSRFQTCVDSETDPDKIVKLFSDPSQYTQVIPQSLFDKRDYGSKGLFFSEILKWFDLVDNLEKKLPETAGLARHFNNPVNSSISVDQLESAFDWLYCKDNLIWCENIIVYAIYRYFMQGYKNRDFNEKTMTGIVLIYIFMTINLAFYYIQNNHAPSTDYQTILLSHLSRLIEHSSEFRVFALDRLKDNDMMELTYLLKLVS